MGVFLLDIFEVSKAYTLPRFNKYIHLCKNILSATDFACECVVCTYPSILKMFLVTELLS